MNDQPFLDFYNTTSENGVALRRAKAAAGFQQKVIIGVFERANRPLSPCQVLSLLDRKDWPITSIRRAITNLTKAGALRKCRRKIKGAHGRSVFVWELNR